jgi:hypothetical protein
MLDWSSTSNLFLPAAQRKWNLRIGQGPAIGQFGEAVQAHSPKSAAKLPYGTRSSPLKPSLF